MRFFNIKNICHGVIVSSRCCFVIAFFALGSFSAWCRDIPADELLALANEQYDQKRYRNAQRMYEKVVEVDPTNARAYNRLGLIASMDDGRLRDSVAYFIEAIKRDHFYAEPYANLGVVFFRGQRFDDAITYLDRAVTLNPNNPEHLFSLAWVYLRGQDDTDKAIELLEKVIALDETHAEAHYVLGLANADAGNKMDVFEQVTALRAINREDLARDLEDLVRTPSGPGGDVSGVGTRGQWRQPITGGGNADEGVTMVYSVETPAQEPAQPVTRQQRGRGQLGGTGTIQFRIQVRGTEQKRHTTGTVIPNVE